MIKIKGTDKYLSVMCVLHDEISLRIVNKDNYYFDCGCLFYIDDSLELSGFIRQDVNFDLTQDKSLKIIGTDAQ
jgi:hypothetical protein